MTASQDAVYRYVQYSVGKRDKLDVYTERARAAKPVADLIQRLPKVKQRTRKWFAMRKDVVLTGSVLSQFFFTQTPEELDNLWQQLMGMRSKDPFTPEARQNIDYGVKNEINAMHSLLYYFPSLTVWEAPFIVHPVHSVIGASPDGIGFMDGSLINIELKCSRSKPAGYPKPPWYYMAQLFYEMRLMGSKETLFACWSERAFKVWRVVWSDIFWSRLWELCVRFLAQDCPWKRWQYELTGVQEAAEDVAKASVALHPRGGFKPLMHPT
jgi:hypothetical protein